MTTLQRRDAFNQIRQNDPDQGARLIVRTYGVFGGHSLIGCKRSVGSGGVGMAGCSTWGMGPELIGILKWIPSSSSGTHEPTASAHTSGAALHNNRTNLPTLPINWLLSVDGL